MRRLLVLALCVILLFDPVLLLAEEKADGTGTSTGGGLTVNILSKVISEGRFDFKATGELLLDWRTWTGALGGMAGMALFGWLGQALLPPGLGVFLSSLPRFLGTSLGFELGRGNLGEIDPFAMAVQVLASTAGYTAFSALLGATAPAWALMAGATLFGVAANLIIRKKVVSIDEDSESKVVAYDSILGKSEEEGLESATASDGTTPNGNASDGSASDWDETVRRRYAELVEAIRVDADDRGEKLKAYKEALATRDACIEEAATR